MIGHVGTCEFGEEGQVAGGGGDAPCRGPLEPFVHGLCHEACFMVVKSVCGELVGAGLLSECCVVVERL